MSVRHKSFIYATNELTHDFLSFKKNTHPSIYDPFFHLWKKRADIIINRRRRCSMELSLNRQEQATDARLWMVI